MAPKPLEVLRKGLAKFTATIEACKKELSAKLDGMEIISSSDEHWLDNDAMSNVFSTPWNQPQTMSKGLSGWTKMERLL
jgi:hypothetical protein